MEQMEAVQRLRRVGVLSWEHVELWACGPEHNTKRGQWILKLAEIAFPGRLNKLTEQKAS
ncbi:MAG TPA: hypothetical protein VL306_00935 [Methylomirabilota bacterium]|jgi:hypothetical protein|nr:hypothetical protein [Methylomirabilota bacterium]